MDPSSSAPDVQSRSPALRWKRIAYDPKAEELTLHYERRAGDDWDSIQLVSHQPPEPAFHRALQELRSDVLEIVELASAIELSELTVRAVALSYHKGDHLGAVITATRTLEHSSRPLVIHTPLQVYSDGEAGMSEATMDAIRDLCDAAEAFLDGRRAQADLFEGMTDGDGEAAAARELVPASAA